MIRALVNDVNVMLDSHIRAQMILASLTLVAYTAAQHHASLCVRSWTASGSGGVVPFMSPAIAAAAVLLIAFSAGYKHISFLLVFLGIWRLLRPTSMRPAPWQKTLESNPLAQSSVSLRVVRSRRSEL